MSIRRKFDVAGAVIGLAGFGLLTWGSGWLPALSVFLVVWGNNLQHSNRVG